MTSNGSFTVTDIRGNSDSWRCSRRGGSEYVPLPITVAVTPSGGVARTLLHTRIEPSRNGIGLTVIQISLRRLGGSRSGASQERAIRQDQTRATAANWLITTSLTSDRERHKITGAGGADRTTQP